MTDHVMQQYEHKVTSQNGEDGIIAFLTSKVWPKTFAEFGADIAENNTLALQQNGWNGTRLDAKDGVWVTAESAPWLLVGRGLPPGALGFLSIDLDGQDYWVWEALLEAKYRPPVVCIEYNASLGPARSVTVPPDPQWIWDGSEFFGASLLALAYLGAAYGYKLAYCDSSGTNAFFTFEPWSDPSPVARTAICWRERKLPHNASDRDDWVEV